MGISREDREAFERGRMHHDEGVLDTLLSMLNVGRAFEYGYDGSQLDAYRKGISGEQLDKDSDTSW